MRAMILAAGLGTRLRPYTDTTPKALLPVAGKSLLQHVIEKLIADGCDHIIINVHHHAEHIIRFLKENNNFNIDIVISDETDLLLDTGGGLLKAKDFFTKNEPFVLSVSDILCDIDLKAMVNTHKQTSTLATLAVRNRPTSRSLMFDDNNNLCAWKNNSTGELKIAREVQRSYPAAFSGIHVISPEIFSLITEHGVFSIIDMYLRLAKTQTIKAYNHDASHWLEFGRTESYEKAMKAESLEEVFRMGEEGSL